MLDDVHDGEHGPSRTCARCGARRSGRIGLVFAFVLGIGVWHLVGFWSFMTSLVHGIEPSNAGLVAAVVKSARPQEWESMMARVERSSARRVVARTCLALARPVSGLEAVPHTCPEADGALRQANGVAVRDHRLATAQPLLVTFGPAAPAPVAGWVARVAPPAPTAEPAHTSDLRMPNTTVPVTRID